MPEIRDQKLETEEALKNIENIEILGRTLNEEFVEISVNKEHIVDVLSALRTDSQLKLDNLHCLSGVDYIKHMEVVYHLFSYESNHKVVVKVRATREDPVVPSIYSLWKTADFQEREVFELYGIEFSGHPNLKRLLLNDDFPGFPFRKDYPLKNDEEWLLEDDRPAKDYGLTENGDASLNE